MVRYCSSCGKEITGDTKFCPSCGKVVVSEASSPIQSQPVQTQAKSKDPGTAAVLSFFITGAGHIYIGQVSYGIQYLLVAIIFTVLGFVGYSFFWVGAALIWIWAIYDAYTAAQKINRGEIKV